MKGSPFSSTTRHPSFSLSTCSYYVALVLPTCRDSATPTSPPQQVNVTIAAVASVAQPLGSTCTNYTVLNIKYSNNIYETLTRASLMVTPPSPLVCVCV